ncbi:hypothetical protein ABZ281_03110, partial [Streptomyces sp. NPDC006265]
RSASVRSFSASRRSCSARCSISARRFSALAPLGLDVPGGTLVITERPDGEIEMTGPAVIVAEGEIDADWLETVTSA